MTEPKFTRGFWARTSEHLRGGRYWTVTIPGCEEIDLHEMDNGEANSALISAAPELYHACAEALRGFQEFTPYQADQQYVAIQKIRAALARARGETYAA